MPKEAGLVEKGIPQEVSMIEDRTDDWPMSMEEAEALREEMMEGPGEKILMINQQFRGFS